MPNHVINEIIFRDAGHDVQEDILKKVLKNGFVDFSVLVPPPLNIWQGNTGGKEKTAFGNKIWSDWNRENWGTKWNAYGQNDEDPENVARTGDTLTLVFQTAWSPPKLWICALFNAVGLPFEHNWLSEGESKAHAAKYFFEGEKEYKTPAWEEQDADEKIYRRLHILLWGDGPESGNGDGETDAQMA
jgi:hypothetical protein